jgi:hypothetical protein
MAWAQATLSSQSDLINKVAQVYGIDKDSDTELGTVVLGLLDDTVRNMNSHLYEFNKIVQDNIPITVNERDVNLNVGVYKESLGYLVRTSDNTKILLVYLPYVHFMDQWEANLFGDAGISSAYTFRNVERDGIVSLGPAPNNATATDYTLTLEYYRRIPLPSEQTEGVDVPPEVETALIYGSQKRLAIHLHGPGHPDVGAFHRLEAEALSALKAVDKRHPDEQKRFRLVDHSYKGKRRLNDGSIYIRIR